MPFCLKSFKLLRIILHEYITEAVKNAIEIDDVKLQKECLKNIQFLAKTTAEKLQ